MLGGDEQLFAEVSRLRGAVGQQLQHALHHLLGILSYQVLIEDTQRVYKIRFKRHNNI